MPEKFDYFILLAEMRTGSNLLESNLNEYPGLKCYGEAFNPVFVGGPKKPDLFGISLSMRERDPIRLIDRMRENTMGLAGFRFFHDHDPRVLDHCLADPRCAKIILTRNPVESYVSWKIALKTDQWRMTNVKNHRSAKIMFDEAEFSRFLTTLQRFQIRLLNALQSTGQSAFYISYDDLQNVDVVNGLVAYLGQAHQLKSLSTNLKKQNPGGLAEKVVNYDEMQAALSRVDHFNLGRTPNFEPRRGAAVPTYYAASKAPLIYLPVRSGPEAQVKRWLAAVDQVDPDALQTGLNQKTLRQWKRAHPGHRSFTVVRHPVRRAHASFCTYILSTEKGSFAEIRGILRRVYKLPVPPGAIDETYDRRQHREAFLVFLKFVKANLGGQTSIRVDANWATQAQIIQDMAQVVMPDMILREDQLAEGLGFLASSAGVSAPDLPEGRESHPIALDDIYDSEVESVVRDVYQRDYVAFGFGDYA